MSENSSFVRHFFRNWQQVAKPRGNDAGFYEILKEINAAEYVPDANATIGVIGSSPEEDHLLALWQAWTMFFRGQEEPAHKTFRTVAKQHPKRPEPWILSGCAYLIQADRKKAYVSFTKARKLAPDIEPLIGVIQKFGTRNKPVIPFLHRDNPMNISLGKVRAKRRQKL